MKCKLHTEVGVSVIILSTYQYVTIQSSVNMVSHWWVWSGVDHIERVQW